MSDIPKKAYLNLDFIQSSAGRPLRMMSEFFEPEARLQEHGIENTIVFFGSARIPSPEDAASNVVAAKNHGGDVAFAERQLAMSRYYGDARELSKRLTEWSMEDPDDMNFEVCTGGGPGIMEAATRGASDAGGKNVGLNITLPHEQLGNPYITPELNFVFHYFFMRKFWFAYLTKAVVVFPGGFGTMDELFEFLTLVTTSKMGKPMPMVLFGTEYWDKVMNLDAMVEFGTISAKELDCLRRVDTVDEAFDYITSTVCEYTKENPRDDI